MTPSGLFLAAAPRPSSTWLPLRSTSGGRRGGLQRETITQVALPATWMHLSLDPRGGRQEANRRPSDPLWWPFLSPRCLTGRKDAVCCPQAPLACSPLLVSTREHRLLIPDSFVLMLAFSFSNPSFCLLLAPPPLPSFFSPYCQHPLYPILTSFLFSFVVFFFFCL